MTLIDNVKKYAKLRGLSLKEVAIKSGFSENTIYGWKTHTPSRGNILAVATTLGVDYEDLTGEEKEKTPKKLNLDAAMHDEDTIMSWQGRPIPPEELEMIRRILDGGK